MCHAMDLKTVACQSAKHLGFGELKEKQIQAVEQILGGSDVFGAVLMLVLS